VDKTIVSFLWLAGCVCSSATAQLDPNGGANKPGAEKPHVYMDTRIYSEAVAFSYPDGFQPGFQRTNGDHFIMELVPKGETVDQWSQMVTVTGTKGLSANPALTPQIAVERIANHFKGACPDTFSATGIGPAKISCHDAYELWASCGTVKSGENAHSESALLVSIKGVDDYYTIQWAERGPASSSPLVFDKTTWMDKLKRLAPITIAPIAPGAPGADSSCADQK
jgi:hypothetical protein